MLIKGHNSLVNKQKEVVIYVIKQIEAMHFQTGKQKIFLKIYYFVVNIHNKN